MLWRILKLISIKMFQELSIFSIMVITLSGTVLSYTLFLMALVYSWSSSSSEWGLFLPLPSDGASSEQSRSYSQIFFKLAVGGWASDMSRDTHCGECHELLFLILHLALFSNTTCFYFNLEIILNRFGNV